MPCVHVFKRQLNLFVLMHVYFFSLTKVFVFALRSTLPFPGSQEQYEVGFVDLNVGAPPPAFSNILHIYLRDNRQTVLLS